MTIDYFNYVSSVRTGEIGILPALVPFLVGFIALWGLSRIIPSLRHLGRTIFGVVGLAATLLGLTLTLVAYPCRRCTPITRGCLVESVGAPFRQYYREIDRPGIYDVCQKCWDNSPAASVANFMVGILAVPLLVSQVRRRIFPKQIRGDK
jgi:hypothetical protein